MCEYCNNQSDSSDVNKLARFLGKSIDEVVSNDPQVFGKATTLLAILSKQSAQDAVLIDGIQRMMNGMIREINSLRDRVKTLEGLLAKRAMDGLGDKPQPPSP